MRHIELQGEIIDLGRTANEVAVVISRLTECATELRQIYDDDVFYNADRNTWHIEILAHHKCIRTLKEVLTERRSAETNNFISRFGMF